MRQAKKPPTKEHPFGHGKEVYFWSFIVALFVFALGAGVSFYEGLIRLSEPHPITHPYINFIIIFFGFLLEGSSWMVAYQAMRHKRSSRYGKTHPSLMSMLHRSKDPSVMAVIFEDSAAILGLIVAFLGLLAYQIFGSTFFDALASMIIGCILAGVAVWLAYESKALLIGESADPKLIKSVQNIFLKDGDTMELSIDNLGKQNIKVIAE